MVEYNLHRGGAIKKSARIAPEVLRFEAGGLRFKEIWLKDRIFHKGES